MPSPSGRPGFTIAGPLFLRALGLVYAIAFVSLAVQVTGLAGHDGILPAAPFLDAVRAQVGTERYWLLPTIFWMGAGDAALRAACWGGALVSVAVALGFAPLPGLATAWVLYLSLATACRTFLNFQWDALLLEAGFLALLVAPWGWRCRVPLRRAPPAWTLWLVRWLLFRLMFSSGVVKLASGDPTWWGLRALDYHYETQPLPPWTAWYAHQLPHLLQALSVLVMFFIELVVPFFVFAPRRLRHVAGALLVGFQILLILTGNFAYFNLLTITLCLVLFDDGAWPRFLRARVAAAAEAHVPVVGAESGDAPTPRPAARGRRWSLLVTVPVGAVLVVVTAAEMTSRFRLPFPWPAAVARTARALQPFRIANSYGLFAVMTTTRPEIIVEGSDDGFTWKPYEFRWKPGDVDRRPRFVAPHQPRLDWQMWFAALSSYRRQAWFASFLARLLQGSPDVLGLLRSNPFPAAPPRYIRSTVYDYQFTDFATRRATGAWWRRTERGPYSPVQSLRR